ncbi:MAG: flagellar biosynthetic protein FliR [Phycisphaeraceae bacterium]|nr:MAG: flagellar biosynthetic protein FliR [Phycisphaeraceae bacterium]
MPDVSAFIQHFGPWLLVFNRVLGVFIFTPLLASGAVPVRFRVLLAAGFAAAVYGFLPPELREMPRATLAEHAFMMFSEVMAGAAIGFIAGLPVVTMEMAGHLMGHQMALSLAQSYNPELETNMNAIGSMLFYMGMSAFILLGGADEVLLILARSFETLPMGGLAAGDAPVSVVLAVLSSGTEIAMRVSAPVLAIILVVLVAMGFIMKTMPQINVLSIGFAIKILGGLSILTLALFTINTVISGHVEQTLNAVEMWVAGLGR